MLNIGVEVLDYCRIDIDYRKYVVVDLSTCPMIRIMAQWARVHASFQYLQYKKCFVQFIPPEH